MKTIFISVIATLLVLAAGFLLYIYSGSYDIAQTSPHNKLTLWAINTTTEHSIESRAKNIKVPDVKDTSMIIEGFKYYNGMCKGCHGAPGLEQFGMVKGLYPSPPEIYKFPDDVPGPAEAFWIIKNGIKMTSMPAYGPTHSDDELWAMAAFVSQKLATMSPDEYKTWQEKYAQNHER
jgi:mono/diheme cytochrome c family protein